MTTTIAQLKGIGDAMMGMAKTNLTEFGHLVPVAGIVQDGEVSAIVGLELPREDKHRSFRRLAVSLRILRPDAVIIVNDAYMRTFPSEVADTYQQGDLSLDHEAKETIIVVFKGPGLVPHICQTVYERGPLGDIVFEPTMEWLPGPQINLLPDWWTS